MQLPHGQEILDTTSTSIDQDETMYAEEYGNYGHTESLHLSREQFWIAKILISDIVNYGKMELLSQDTTIIKLKTSIGDKAVALIPQAGPSWYEPDLGNSGAQSSPRCVLTNAAEEPRQEMGENETAVDLIKMEIDDMAAYVFYNDDDEDEPNN